MKSFIQSLLPSSKYRIEGLDLMRSFAIAFVVFYHAWGFMLPYFKGVGSLFFMGFWGVELFFVLSGFLVGGIFISVFINSEKYNGYVMLQFWKRRWNRTIPIYLVILFINYFFVVYYIKIPFSFPFEYLIFIQNLFKIHPLFFPEAWSLCVEEWFYLTLPILFIPFSFSRFSKNTNIIIVYIALLIIVYTCIRIVNIPERFDLMKWDFGLRKIVVYRLDAILYGVLFYLINRKNSDFLKSYRYYFLFLGGSIILISYYIFYLKLFPIYNTVFFTSFTSLGMALCLPFFIHFKFKNYHIKNFFTILSVISYSMYLIHYTLVFRFYNKDLVTQNLSHAFGIFTMYLFTVLFLSILVHKYLEKPLIERK